MNNKERKLLNQLYQKALEEVNLLYEGESNAEETTFAEGRVEQLKEVLSALNIEFKD